MKKIGSQREGWGEPTLDEVRETPAEGHSRWEPREGETWWEEHSRDEWRHSGKELHLLPWGVTLRPELSQPKERLDKRRVGLRPHGGRGAALKMPIASKAQQKVIRESPTGLSWCRLGFERPFWLLQVKWLVWVGDAEAQWVMETA